MPITFVVPLPPGPQPSRSHARRATAPWPRRKKTASIDSKAGASGFIAWQQGAKAKPDGYTSFGNLLQQIAEIKLLHVPC